MTEAPEETRDGAEIICPWCGYRHRDAWEMVDYNERSIDGECEECEKPIRYHVYVSHTYICEPITE